MPKASKPKRKQPITSTPVTAAAPNHKAGQCLIQRYHTLLKLAAKLRRSLSNPSSSQDASSTAAELEKVEEEMEALGGLEAYQVASTAGQSGERGGDSSKVLVGWLEELELPAGISKRAEGKRKIKTLEIGALSPTNLISLQPYISNTPIDLNSRDPKILKQDFMDRAVPTLEEDKVELVSCSLVLNFVPDAEGRGKMLRHIHNHLQPQDTSLLFLVLPLPCIMNSRYVTQPHFLDLMKVVGFEMVKERYKPGGKVGYWLFKWTTPQKSQESFQRKVVINEGKKRNNFAITL